MMGNTVDGRTERRRSRRVRRRLNVTLTGSGGVEIHGQTADISAFGFRLILDHDVQIRKDERFSLIFTDTNSVTSVRVVRTDRRQDCVFVGLDRVPVHEGDLAATGLHEVLFGLMEGRETGELCFSRAGTRKSIFLEMGEIVYAESDQDYDSLPSVLVRGGRISESEFNEAWATHVKRPTTPMDRILMEMGCLDEEGATDAALFRTRSIVRGLFEWSEGSFEFIENKPPPAGSGRLGISSADLIVSGIRNMSQERIRAMLDPIREIPLSRTEDPLRLFQQVTLMPKEKTLMELVDGKTPISGLMDRSNLSENAIYSAVAVLVGTCLVELGETIADESEIPDTKTSNAEQEAISERIDRMYYRLGEMGHYELLGVSANANNGQIKKAYYNMAREFHPDINNRLGNGFEQKVHAIFSQINFAYDILSDEKKRRDYDKTIYMGTGRPAAKSSGASTSRVPTAEDRFRQGNMKFKIGDFEGAAELFLMATRLNPEKANYQFAAGQAFMRVPRKMKEAEECILKAIEIEPYNSGYLMALGNLYLKARLGTRARRIFSEVLNMDPGNKDAREGLAAAENL